MSARTPRSGAPMRTTKSAKVRSGSRYTRSLSISADRRRWRSSSGARTGGGTVAVAAASSGGAKVSASARTVSSLPASHSPKPSAIAFCVIAKARGRHAKPNNASADRSINSIPPSRIATMMRASCRPWIRSPARSDSSRQTRWPTIAKPSGTSRRDRPWSAPASPSSPRSTAAIAAQIRPTASTPPLGRKPRSKQERQNHHRKTTAKPLAAWAIDPAPPAGRHDDSGVLPTTKLARQTASGANSMAGTPTRRRSRNNSHASSSSVAAAPARIATSNWLANIAPR